MLEALLVGAGKPATGRVRAMGEVGLRVAVVVEPDPDRRAALVSAQGVPHAYPDLAAVPPSAHGVRCAFVATPPWLHADAFVRCVELGLPVFCEKPLDEDLAAAERMLRAALRSGVPSMCGFNRRTPPWAASRGPWWPTRGRASCTPPRAGR